MIFFILLVFYIIVGIWTAFCRLVNTLDNNKRDFDSAGYTLLVIFWPFVLLRNLLNLIHDEINDDRDYH